MTRKDEIRAAYKSLGKAHSMYDGMMLGTTFTGRLVSKAVWNMTPEEEAEYPARIFEAIPKDFTGKILEVPVGTGVLSMPVFKTLEQAQITCLDYSEKMMESAKERADGLNISNITFVQGDVGSLPFADESFDTVVSLNGFHAFPDKEAAFRETYRVLKKGGMFTGCFYIEGIEKRSDFFLQTLYTKAGFFTPPFETLAGLKRRLENMYSSAEVSNLHSIGIFRCIK